MALTKITQFHLIRSCSAFRTPPVRETTPPEKNRDPPITESRSFAAIPVSWFSTKCHCPELKEALAEEEIRCREKNFRCGDPPRPSKATTFWSKIFGGKKKPPKETCRSQMSCKPDPDLSMMGGTAYKTCGKNAYIVQRDKELEVGEEAPSKEDLLVKRIEFPIGCKLEAIDPMPTFTSVEQRMLDLNDRRLHPLYKRYQGMSRKKVKMIDYSKIPRQYLNVSLDLLKPEDIPKKIKFNKELLEKKNIFAEFKMVEPPRNVLGKLIEMNRNMAPGLRFKGRDVCREEAPKGKKKQIFDNLEQKEDPC